jgi:hypothetical protein
VDFPNAKWGFGQGLFFATWVCSWRGMPLRDELIEAGGGV